MADAPGKFNIHYLPAQPVREQEIVVDIMREFSELQNWRNTAAMQWEEIAQLIMPTSRNTFFYGNFNWPGMKKTDRQIDATGMMALERFSAICDSMITPRNSYWHQLSSPDEYVMKDRDTRLWFEEATKALFTYRYNPMANFSAQNQNVYTSMGAFGTGAVMPMEFHAPAFKERGLRYIGVPLGQLFFTENEQGLIDGFIRWFRLTARQAHMAWPDKLPPQLQTAMEQHSEFPYNFLHRVCVQRDYDPDRIDSRGMSFSSQYVSIEGHMLLEEGGFRTFPMAITRYRQTPDEVYGRGPASFVLPALKTLNAEKGTFLKVGHRAADPVLLVADDGLIDISLRPGAINKGGLSADGKKLIDVLPTGQIQTTLEMMQEERGLINDAFLVSLFQILTQTPQMTATEVIERVSEKGILMAPTLGRQQSEYLGPLIHRELDVLFALKLLRPMPPRLLEAGGNYDVVYTSPLSLAMKAGQAAGFMRTLESVKELVAITQDPSLLHPFNFSVAIPAIARIQAVPESWMASDEQMQQKADALAQNQQRQQQIQAAPAAAAMMKAQAVASKANGGRQAPASNFQPTPGSVPGTVGAPPPAQGQ